MFCNSFFDTEGKLLAKMVAPAGFALDEGPRSILRSRQIRTALHQAEEMSLGNEVDVGLRAMRRRQTDTTASRTWGFDSELHRFYSH